MLGNIGVSKARDERLLEEVRFLFKEDFFEERLHERGQYGVGAPELADDFKLLHKIGHGANAGLEER
jgi:hypothetical protein